MLLLCWPSFKSSFNGGSASFTRKKKLE
ncbi:hypothetical protein A2U01_0107950, partial [Trifolium medium]|nr:hypothetical protein [Trifolium medium]